MVGFLTKRLTVRCENPMFCSLDKKMIFWFSLLLRLMLAVRFKFDYTFVVNR